MKIVGLVSWYDEKPDFLAACVASMASFVDHVVAVDGAYIMYPGGKAQSPTGQVEAIRETARACHLGCTVHEPQERWGGNEVEKRAFMFSLAETVAKDANDWYFVLDADEVVSEVGMDVRETLLTSEHDVGQVTCWQHRGHYEPQERPFVSEMVEQQQLRKFFRAIPGLTVTLNHYTYVVPDGRHMWGMGGPVPLEQPEDMPLLKVEHRNKGRDLWRAQQARSYYERRDELKIETQETT